jgi:hypothetical protein
VTKRKATTFTVLYPEEHEDSNGAPVNDAPDELAHALVQPMQPMQPEFVAGADGGLLAPEMRRGPYGPELPATPQRPRRISAEVVKAETKLIQIERSRDESLRHHALSWDQKRASYIRTLPDDVRAALVAMKVLGADDGEAT